MSTTSTHRVALVTGSGKRRVGRHVAVALAERGYDVAVHYRTSANDAAEAVDDLAGRGVDAEAFQADLTDESSVRRLVQAARDRFGRLDLLVNCAAVYAPLPLEKVTADDVRRNFEVNLLGTFLCSQQAGLAMVGQPEGGLIVNIADWALARPYLNYAAYFASKGSIPDLTRCLAVELGTRNPRVRVNCILPGPVLFPPDMPQAERDQAIASTLVKRAGQPENIASAVGFFVDNDFVTGVCLPIDGGRTIFAAGS